MLVLLLVSLLAVTGLERSGEESVSGARLRSSTKTLHAADSGIRFALNRLRQSPPNLDAFVVPLASASIASQTRTDPAPQDIEELGFGERAEGYGLNAGTGTLSIARVYEVHITATGNGSTVELEARLMRSGIEVAGY